MESVLILTGVVITSVIVAYAADILHGWLDDRAARRRR